MKTIEYNSVSFMITIKYKKMRPFSKNTFGKNDLYFFQKTLISKQAWQYNSNNLPTCGSKQVGLNTWDF